MTFHQLLRTEFGMPPAFTASSTTNTATWTILLR
jgi:hypothetical protein